MSIKYDDLFPMPGSAASSVAMNTQRSRGERPVDQIIEYDCEKRIQKITHVYSDGSQEYWDVTWDGETNDVMVIRKDGQGSLDAGKIWEGQCPLTIILEDAPNIDEGQPAVFRVRYVGTIPAGQTISVDLTTVDGTAVAGTNYVTKTETVTFTDIGPTEYEFIVTTLDDGQYQPGKNFTVQASNPTNTFMGDMTAEIVNGMNEISPTPPVQIYVDDAPTVNEGEDAIFVVRYIGDITEGEPSISVDLTTADGTGVAGTNYVAKTETFTFVPGGAKSQQFIVTTIDDQSLDPDKTFFANATNLVGNGAIVDDQGQATLGELTEPPIEIFVDDAPNINEGEDAVFNVRYTGTISPGQPDVTVDLTTADDTATAGTNYVAKTETVTFTEGGPTSVLFTVTTIDDGQYDPGKNFFVNASNLVGNGSITDGQAIVTGGMNELAELPIEIFVDDAPNIDEGQPAEFVVRYTGTIAAGQPPVTVDLATADGTGVAGTNYVAKTETFTFIAGGPTSQTFTVTTLSDEVTDPGKNFFVNASNLVGNGTITDGQAIVTDDMNEVTIIPIEIYVDDTPATLSEGEDAVFNVRYTGDLMPNASVSVDVATADGTGIDTINYEGLAETITFTEGGDTSIPFTVTTISDEQYDPGKNFVANLSNVVGDGIIIDNQATANMAEVTHPCISETPTDVNGDKCPGSYREEDLYTEKRTTDVFGNFTLYGASVAVSDDEFIVAVGSPGAIDWDGTGKASGCVEIYVKPDPSVCEYALIQTIFPSNGVDGQRFGQSVAITGSGHVLVVGAPSSTDTTDPTSLLALDNAGCFYVFDLVPEAGDQQTQNIGPNISYSERSVQQYGNPEYSPSKVMPAEPEEDMNFGFAVAITDSANLIFASTQKPGDKGRIFVFDRVGQDSRYLERDAKILNTNVTTDLDTNWGYSLGSSWNGAYLAIGQPTGSAALHNEQGFVDIAENQFLQTGQWAVTQAIVDPNDPALVPKNSKFGVGVAWDSKQTVITIKGTQPPPVELQDTATRRDREGVYIYDVDLDVAPGDAGRYVWRSEFVQPYDWAGLPDSQYGAGPNNNNEDSTNLIGGGGVDTSHDGTILFYGADSDNKNTSGNPSGALYIIPYVCDSDL